MQSKSISSHDANFKSNIIAWEKTRPTMESITKRDTHDLDKRNRFFKDNKKLYSTYKHKDSQLYVYKSLSPRAEPVAAVGTTSQHD